MEEAAKKQSRSRGRSQRKPHLNFRFVQLQVHKIGKGPRSTLPKKNRRNYGKASNYQKVIPTHFFAQKYFRIQYILALAARKRLEDAENMSYHVNVFCLFGNGQLA